MSLNKKLTVAKLHYDIALQNLDATYELSLAAEECKQKKSNFFARYSDIESVYKNFVELHIDIQCLSGDDFNVDEHKSRFETYTNKYYSIKSKYNDMCTVVTDNSETSNTVQSDAHFKKAFLPKLQLPVYSGKIEEYASFIDIFYSIVGNDKSLTDTEKLYYLVGVLEGEPKTLIRHLSITGENYSVALDLLKSRYGNKRLIADKLLHNLLSVAQVNKSLNSLKNFLNVILETTKALEKLEFPVMHWSYLLLYINLQKIDYSLKKRFEDKIEGKEIPTFQDFIKFLENEVKILECSSPMPSTERGHKGVTGKSGFQRNQVSFQATAHQSAVCSYCKRNNHHISKCDRFISLKPRVRKQQAVMNKLCFRCLNLHSINNCEASNYCSHCRSNKHHSLLHFDVLTGGHTAETTPGTSAVLSSSGSPQQQNVLHAMAPGRCHRTVLLSTAIVQLMDSGGNYHKVRALLDGGSQSTFISYECQQRLGLRRFKSDIVAVKGLCGTPVKNCRGSVMLTLRPCHVTHPVLVTAGYVLGKITDNLPSVSLPQNLRNEFSGILLADENFYESRKIDLLIGADLLGSVMVGGGILRFGDHLPSAVNTIFGFVLMGPVAYMVPDWHADHAVNFSQTFMSVSTTDKILEKFWEIEEIPQDVRNPKDVECEKHFLNTYKRDEEGRYIVRLPFLSERLCLGDSRQLALKRFYSLEKRLQKDHLFRDKYVNFMKEYEELGHMTLVDESAVNRIQTESYIIPHHGIFKSDSDKIRVVFDASCRTDTGLSLNDCLHAGPKLQMDIMEIICRFRLFQVVFTADIRMMFRCIYVHEDDRKYQLIYWRESPNLPLRLYALNTVTYGMKSSPYLAIRVLRQLASDGERDYSAAARLLKTSVYMDDILGGANTRDEAKRLKEALSSLLASGGFELRKWTSNEEELLADIPMDHHEKPHIFDYEGGLNYVKILGIQWNPSTDVFTYHTKLPRRDACTKRTILSTLARTFDPLGWIAPVVFQGKVLIQQLWVLGLGWDDNPPDDVCSKWETIMGSLPHIQDIKLARCILPTEVKHCALHGFADASELGYGVAVYLRVEDSCGNVSISLIMAKSRVAPVKCKLTIPKLELCGATLLARVVNYVKLALQDNININEIICWSDSTIVLSWLKISPHLLQTFEANRVSQIHNIGFDISWRYVPTHLNPADVASRGCNASELKEHSLWWGPEWLKANADHWPLNLVNLTENNLPALRKSPVLSHNAVIDADMSILSRFSSLSKLQAVVAYILRFANNAKSNSVKISGVLSVSERKNALLILIKMVQVAEFFEDIESLKRNKQCSMSLRRLMPFIDEDGLLRVGGRLKNADLHFGIKHPILLPKASNLTKLIINYYHVTYCHIGPSALQAVLQQQYWIVSAKRVIRSCIYKCMHCFRLRAKPNEPVMADLPSDRVNVSGVFHTVQTDFAGPFTIKASGLRNSKRLKAYLCVFVCSSSKAVHLEVVGDLSTEGFLAALTRFTSRRGLPNMIRSDCGTNYVGTNRHLNEVQRYLADRETQADISNKAAQKGITWRFNPPAAPHFGGLFEAAVKCAKTLLRRVIGEQVLTYEELATLFARIEAVLNSRPLCPLSLDPAEFDVLTPAHLLIGRPLLTVPEYDWGDISMSRLSRFQMLQRMAQHFWKRWRDEYLKLLQVRSKWTSAVDPPKIGDLVLIKDDDVSPLRWKLGRINKLLPGKDGVVRIVELKTPSGTLTRPVVKVCRLPIED